MRTLLLFLCLVAAPAFGQTNHLRGAQSPYLLQHLDNPVDWYPWGPEALAKAKSEQKLIFVSVGYSACHWCHVMEEESFENQKIAAFMNAHFVSIKIDREERPDLDEQFMMVTQLAIGAGGWPNSAFLTPEGKPFYGTTYMPPEDFRSILGQVVDLWQTQPVTIINEGLKFTRALDSLLAQQATRLTLPPTYFQSAAITMLERIDPFNGGIGTATKFPREPLFLFLLDQATRSGDRELLSAVTQMLDGMIMGGIHDHVGGGFHRYAVDPAWHVPHFEKMLYTQALTGRLLIRAWSATGEIRYKRAANRLFDFVLQDLRAPEGGFYSALDADSNTPDGELLEGVFYTWTPSELAATSPQSTLISGIYQVTANGDVDGRNVLNLANLPGDVATDLGLDEDQLYALLDPLLETLHAERTKRQPPFKDQKIVVAWNAGMIETLAEAAGVLERPELFDAAAKAANFILHKMNGNDGLDRIFINGKSSVAAQLPDYAALGLALVALHDNDAQADRRQHWLKAAQDMASSILQNFGLAENGYFMAQKSDGITRMIPVDDTELPSGNAMTLALFARLVDRAAVPDIQQAANVLVSTLSGFAQEIPDQRASALMAVEDFQSMQSGAVLYRSQGNVRVTFAKTAKNGGFKLGFDVRDGWHINSANPLEDYFIPTTLSVQNAQLEKLLFPAPVIKSLGFNKGPLSLLEGRFVLEGAVKPAENTAPAPVLKLEFQACSNEICLQPETLNFTLW